MVDRSERLVAGQLADVKESIDSMRDTMGKRAPPVVTVNVPEAAVNVKVPEQLPPNVHLNFLEPPPAPTITVNVPEIKAPAIHVKQPIVNVLPPEARAYDVRITERDENGFIRAFKITPA
jgi:hypothetical protein